MAQTAAPPIDPARIGSQILGSNPPDTIQRVPIPVDPKGPRLKVLILSGGGSYEHDWAGTNSMLRALMLDSKRFDVRVIEDFAHGNLETLKAYHVVLINYGSRWYSGDAEQVWSNESFQAIYQYVREGGGLVAYHSGLSFARNIPEFRRLVGTAVGTGGRKSPPSAFLLHMVDRTHPITAGMREFALDLWDDMFTNTAIDPEAKVRVLVTAHDSPANYDPQLLTALGPKYPLSSYTPEKVKAMKGMDGDHPQAWTNEYGKGRVFAFSIGHDAQSLRFDAVKTLILRGTEWAASGAVTLPVFEDAKDYPTK